MDDEATFECRADGEQALGVEAAAAVSIFGFLVVVFTVTLNGLVAFSIVRTPKLRAKAHNVYILALTICDGVVGAAGWPVLIHQMLYGCWAFSPSFCTTWQAVSFFAFTCSKYLLPLLTYDGYRIIQLGASYDDKETASKSVKLVACVVAIVIGLLVYTAVMKSSAIGVDGVCMPEIYVDNALAGVVLLVVGDVVPLVALIVGQIASYSSLLVHVKRLSHNMQMSAYSRARQARRGRKAFRTMLLLATVFILCLAPEVIAEVFLQLCGVDDDDIDFTGGGHGGGDDDDDDGDGGNCGLSTNNVWFIMQFSFAILYLNSLLNPLLYAYSMPGIRKALKKLLYCRASGIEPANVDTYDEPAPQPPAVDASNRRTTNNSTVASTAVNVQSQRTVAANVE